MDIANFIKNLIFKGKLDQATEILNNLLSKDNDNPIVYNLLGVIETQYKNFKKAEIFFDKAIKLDKKYSEAYYNLGALLHNQGKFNNAEINFLKANLYKKKYINAIFLLGQNYFYQRKLKKSIECYLNILSFQPSHSDSFISLLNALTYTNEKLNFQNDIIRCDNNLKEIPIEIDLNKKILDEEIKIFVKKILKTINYDLLYHQSLNTQTYKQNYIELKCDRHHKVFNTFSIIPKFCFSCFKIQICPKNIIDIIKLYLFFNNSNLLQKNNKKCFVEMRDNIPGTYKGLIYCSSLEEAEKLKDELKVILRTIIDNDILIEIKRGCSEFSKRFKEYSILKKDELMRYNSDWKNFESEIDKLIPIKDKIDNDVKLKTYNNLNLKDALAILNFIRYAKVINDKSYDSLIDFEIPDSPLLNINLVFQKELRKIPE